MSCLCRKALVAVGLVFCLFSPLFAYSGGSGEPSDPYLIATPADIDMLGASPNDWGKCFKLVADINMAEFTGTQYKIIGTSYDDSFRGIFDGNGYVIRNLTYTTDASIHYVGLFGYVGFGGQIRNLGIENVNIIVNNGNCVGGLCGRIIYNGSIINCYSTGTVSGYRYIGGLCGDTFESNIINCYSTCTVSAYQYVGGLCGVIDENRSVTSCYSTGNVSGTTATGGLCGYLESSSITNCYSTGNVNGIAYTGGLCGQNYYEGSITNCYATGNVTGNEGYTGGLCGYEVSNGSYTHCYFLNTAGPDNGLGEPLTDVQMKQQASYKNWDFGVDIWIMDEGASYPVFIWQNIFVVTVVPDVTGMTEADANAVIVDANLILGAVTTAYSPTVPQGYIIEQTPAAGILAVEGSAVNIVISLGVKYSGGSGEPNAPYLIATPADMNTLGASSGDWGKCFKLVADIDMSAFPGTQYKIIGNLQTRFTGTFDGDGHIIHNLTYTTTTSTSSVGLFGYIYNAAIKDLGLENVNVSTGGNYIGCLAGWAANSTIVNCYCMGTVLCSSNSSSTAGGLVGSQMYSTIITNCYSMGSVSCTSTGSTTWSNAGGLVGSQNGGTITNCYSTCAVTCSSIYTSVVGGLVGNQSDRSGNTKIENCYFAGQVSATGSTIYKGGLLGYYGGYRTIVIAGNFWDMDISGTSDGVGNITPDPNGVMGKTTAEMQTLSTFTSAGWDFSYTDGDKADWFIQIDEYPILTWQISPADIYTDGRNNFRDFAIFAQYWMREDCAIYNYYCDWADLNFDGSVDIDDLVVLISYWLQSGIYE